MQNFCAHGLVGELHHINLEKRKVLIFYPSLPGSKDPFLVLKGQSHLSLVPLYNRNIEGLI